VLHLFKKVRWLARPESAHSLLLGMTWWFVPAMTLRQLRRVARSCAKPRARPTPDQSGSRP